MLQYDQFHQIQRDVRIVLMQQKRISATWKKEAWRHLPSKEEGGPNKFGKNKDVMSIV